MAESPSDVEIVLTLAAQLSLVDGIDVQERLLDGLWFLQRRCEVGLTDERLRRRIRHLGAQRLIDAASRAAQLYNGGGGKVWSDGMLIVINKGLPESKQFKLRGDKP